MATSQAHGNRLAHETSPYLLQHARNPVDWYPWGHEALDRAKREDKPILLSIGYAACHWCHVMERESFESEDVAAVMNANFVCIKVDREERPDLDDVYMAATIAMSGHGGWPMTVFLTPRQEPFFAGTYFPPDDRHGRPGFKTLLLRIAELWKSDRQRLVEQASELTDHVRGRSSPPLPGAVGEDAIVAAASDLVESFDPEYGGFGGAPKFPPSASLSLLLRLYHRRPEDTLLTVVTKTLDAMKSGGIYDHLGGGFARYSVDERWLVPHFEKMLYDNAQLARVYLEAYQVTGSPEYGRVAAETLDYIAREMQSADGGYYSATDADSEGVEGKFFVWTLDQLEEVLGRPATEWFAAYYDVTAEGNWEDVSILNTPRSLEAVAEDLGTPAETLRASLADSRQKLYAARLRRVPPLTDDKVLTAWNGLMISAMAEGARVLRDRRYLVSAERAARFIQGELSRSDGGLYRTARAGKAHLDAYLEDYAFFADALVDLYEAGGAERFFLEAVRLAERMIADFGDPEGGPFFQTAHGHEALIARTREGHDGAIPNANAVAARLLARLGFHLGREDLRERALGAIRAYGRAIERAPRAFATTLAVVDLLLEAPVELAIVGAAGSAEREALEAEVARHHLPNRVVAHAEPGGPASELPLLVGKTPVVGQAALYVCRDFACQAPVTRAEEVSSVLGRAVHERGQDRGHVVGAKVLGGAATPGATHAHAARFAEIVGPEAYVELGPTRLRVSRLGFGSYRVDDRVDAHREALVAALTQGVNLIDTSTNYSDGHSERLIGEVLAELDRKGSVRREAVVVVSKIGYAQGENLSLAEAQEAAGRPFPEMVKVGEGIWHCIHPDWIEEQLGRSLARLELEALDVCLLHNPEYFLADAAKRRVPLAEARPEYYRRITEAFRKLEEEVARGRIRFYGVSSNTLVDAASSAEATSVSLLLDAARDAGGEAHHFRVLELPMNLLEAGAALERNTGADGQKTPLEVAREAGIAVLVNRPLNAILEGRLLRLADPPEYPDAPPLADQLELVKALEAEFVTVFGSSIRLSGENAPRASDVFRWGEQLGAVAAELESHEQWREMEARAVAPRIMQAIRAIGQVIPGPLAGRWEDFQDRYLDAIDGLFLALRKRAGDRSRRRTLLLGRTIDPLLPEELRGAPLSQKTLTVTADTPGVTTVLVGMREPGYVEDCLRTLHRLGPALGNTQEILAACRALELP